LGLHFQQLGIWPVIEMHVQIPQKTRVHRPLDKLLDCFLNLLAGGQGLVEVNTRVRPDRAVQRAFGRMACAEQSTVSRTVSACEVQQVTQMQSALKQILQQHSQSVRHDYARDWQVLDVDMTGLAAGRLAEGAQKGYFPQQPQRRGRQLGRVLATRYDEIVVDQLYDGKRQLDKSLPALMQIAEDVLELAENRRERTIVRSDAGGGDDANINWLLARGYAILVKVKNWRCAEKLARSVTRWVVDPKRPAREAGWVEQPRAYVKPTRQLALRTRKKNGDWSFHVVVCTLSDACLAELAHEQLPIPANPDALLFIALHAYDKRGGGLETQTRGDKQGLGLSHRNKQSFPAQQMLVLLAQLAHNVVIWTRNDLARADSHFQHYGIQRTVRDALQIDGQVAVTADGRVKHIALNPAHPLTLSVARSFLLCT
jgi:hypothetical protein